MVSKDRVSPAATHGHNATDWGWQVVEMKLRINGAQVTHRGEFQVPVVIDADQATDSHIGW